MAGVQSTAGTAVIHQATDGIRAIEWLALFAMLAIFAGLVSGIVYGVVFVIRALSAALKG